MHVSNPSKARAGSEFDLIAWALISLAGAAISLVATGCILGVRNDLYFLPIFGALYDQPQFSGDLFIQSLRHYASGPWMVLAGLDQYLDASWLFLFLGFFSRLLAFLGFLACADLLGIRSRKDRIMLTFLLCATSLLRGQSLAGDGGLFINYFSHSEVANGLTLLLLYASVRGWVLTALVLEGAIFFDNAFIAVWDGAILLAVAATFLKSHKLNFRAALPRLAVGVTLAICLSLPVIWNIIQNPDFGKHFGFDYVAFLEEFWPYHFIFSDIPLRDKLDFASMIAMGISAFYLLGKEARPFLAAFIGLLALYGIGIVIPHLTHNSFILNLHLLRDSTILQLLAVLGSLVLAVRWWASNDRAYAGFFAPILMLLLCLPIRMTTIQPTLHFALACGLFALSTSEKWRTKVPDWVKTNKTRLGYGAAAAIIIGFVIVIGSNLVTNARAEAWIGEWDATGHWARTNTAPEATFLIPTWYFRGSVGRTKANSEEDEAVLNAGIFQYSARRRVWIDFRNGAAVMWSPSYYNEWHRKVTEVNGLNSRNAEVSYAQTHGIGYIIDVCSGGSFGSQIFSTGRLCVFRVPSAASPSH